jgi:hypothetical protein
LALCPLESVTVSLLLIAPSLVGVKVTSTEHFSPGANAVPPQLSGASTVKSSESASPMERVAIVAGRAALFGLEMVTVLGLLVAPVTPNTSGPKLKLPGVTCRVVPAAKAAPDCRRLATSARAGIVLRRFKSVKTTAARSQPGPVPVSCTNILPRVGEAAKSISSMRHRQ